MAKRSKPAQMDIVTETQQNSRWFFGRHGRGWMEMSKAEWSRYIRAMHQQPTSRRGGLIAGTIILLIGLAWAARSAGEMLRSGFSLDFVVMIFVGILILGIGVLSVRRALQDD